MTENNWEARAIAAEQRLASAEQQLTILRGTVTQDAALIAQLIGAKAAAEATIASLHRLAKEATNSWACYAKRKIEHDDISRLHREIDALKGEHGA